jgi:hypothetical protein
MFHVNDDIQNTAQAFGERFFLQNAFTAYDDECFHMGARNILEKTIYLHMITYLNENMGWYLSNGLVSRQAAKDLASKQGAAVKAFAPYINDVVEAFGLIKTPQLHGPVSRDYVKFNAQTDMNNLEAAGGLFDFTQKVLPKHQHIARL